MRKNLKINLFKPAILVLIFTMLVGTIFFAVDTATAGAEISKLENEIYSLSKENRELGEEVIKLSSVSAIDTSAEDLGFAKPEKTVYLTLDGFSASAYAQ